MQARHNMLTLHLSGEKAVVGHEARVHEQLRTCDEDTAEEGFGTVCELVLPLRLFVRMKRHEGDVDQHQSTHQQVEAHGPHYLCVHVECVRHVCISGRHDPKPTQALPQRAHAGEDGRRGQYRTPKEVGGDVRVRGE